MSKLGQIVLYYNPFSRAGRVRWMLEELGLPYEIKFVDMQKGEHKSPAHLKVHPLGLVPAMTIDGRPMIESAAMCLWLSEQCPEKKMVPTTGTVQKADFYQWSLFAMNHIEPELVKVFMHTKLLPEAERSASVLEKAKEGAKVSMDVLAQCLAKNKYVAGSEFTTADVLVGSLLIWGAAMELVHDPTLKKYIDSVKGRPAFQRAQQKI